MCKLFIGSPSEVAVLLIIHLIAPALRLAITIDRIHHPADILHNRNHNAPKMIINHEQEALYSDGISDDCNIADAVRSSNYQDYFDYAHNHAEFANAVLPSQYNNGAVVSLWSSVDRAAAMEQWKCQLLNHQRYCDRHGYTCYFVADSEHWHQMRKHIHPKNHNYWLKIQILSSMLDKHPWTLYLDTDSVMWDPLTAPSIEEIISNHEQKQLNRGTKSPHHLSLYLPGGAGWNTDIIFLRNTHWSHLFLEHLWRLRYACPNVNGEQGAANVATYDSLVYHLFKSNPETWLYRIHKDQSKPCCIPVNYCPLPEGAMKGYASRRYQVGDYSSQGCTINWLRATNFSTDAGEYYRPDHPFIAWDGNLRTLLNISHPVKSMECELDSKNYAIALNATKPLER